MVGLFSITVLGPLSVCHFGRNIGVGGPKQRAILAALVLSDGMKLTTQKLAEALWGDAPPRTAPETLRTHVYLLRKALRATGVDLVRTCAWTYALAVDNDVVDLDRFRRHVSSAEAAKLAGNVERAAVRYQDGLDLWHGEALTGVPGPFAESKRRSLGELRLTTLARLLWCRMVLGAHREVAAELFALTAENPLDEGLRELLMVCLYRAGRQSDALAVFRDTRRLLAEQLGVAPSPRLHRTHQRILDNDATLMSPAPEEHAPRPEPHSPTSPPPSGRPAFHPPKPAQLPKAPAHFTGREEAIAQIDAAARDGALAVVVEGMPGVGKTTLALHCAHRLASQFPDGQLYLDLGGFSSRSAPLPTTVALKRLLVGLGVPSPAIPAEVEERTALYRSLLAGKRFLVLLDNSCGQEQIRALLPGTADSTVMVTSRFQARGLVVTDGAQRTALAEFTPSEARHFLAGRLGERGRSAPVALLDRIAARCGRLPLALAVVAAQATDLVDVPLYEIARELDDGHGSLDVLRMGPDTATDLREVFAPSYRRLSAESARLFRRLARHRDTDVTTADAARLLGVPAGQAGAAHAELGGASLLTQHGHDRYRMHTLMRDYATELNERAWGVPVP